MAARGLEQDRRAYRIDPHAADRVGAHERHLQRRQVEDVGDAVVDDGFFELLEIGNVAADHVELGQLRVIEDQFQPMPAAGQVVGRDRHPFAKQALDRPGPDAAKRAGHQKSFRHGFSSRE